ncbi:2'-5' RNA ligase [Peribacillus deserti]|uniref:RNA 2',3'-cyclic phosphodiesterase n=1 Tax=Peribacillus deserti TaxID=673318 RepID=A0ABS2QIF1_9BACI|nr:RNA 2',3'-cyclic phosphodiesterase [Peribacillus deserti]MBM7692943.1 2'-5' RNA ligase [Peribacillus deserti]
MTNSNYFYALKLPNEAKYYIHENLTELKDKLTFNKWVHPEDFHITLAFLGKVEEEKLKDSIQKVRNSCLEQPGFSLKLTELGIFGPAASPRILWAGVQNEDRLYSLQKAVYISCEEAGFLLDKKPFKPHITVARKYKGDNKFNPDSLSTLGEFTFTADRFTLYKTNIGMSPSYETIQDFNLNIME